MNEISDKSRRGLPKSFTGKVIKVMGNNNSGAIATIMLGEAK